MRRSHAKVFKVFLLTIIMFLFSSAIVCAQDPEITLSIEEKTVYQGTDELEVDVFLSPTADNEGIQSFQVAVEYYDSSEDSIQLTGTAITLAPKVRDLNPIGEQNPARIIGDKTVAESSFFTMDQTGLVITNDKEPIFTITFNIPQTTQTEEVDLIFYGNIVMQSVNNVDYDVTTVPGKITILETPYLDEIKITDDAPDPFYVTQTFDLSNLTLEGEDQYGDPYDISGETVEWVSSDTTVATVDGNELTALAAGTTDVTAKINSVESDPITFTVSPRKVTEDAVAAAKTVAFGTAFADLDLPATVTANLSYGTAQMDVVWSEGDYDGNTEGKYTLEGALQAKDEIVIGDKKALIDVTVGPDMLALSDEQPPSGHVDEEYYHEFIATGGEYPYTFAVTAGSLPDGLTLVEEDHFDEPNNGHGHEEFAGELKGTPTTAGEFTFTITVTDAANDTDSQQFTIEIEDARSADNTLKRLTTDIGTLVPAFDPQQTTYAITLRSDHDAANIPTITAEANDEKATVEITQADAIPGKAEVKVTAENETVREYTINIRKRTVVAKPPAGTPEAPAAIDINAAVDDEHFELPDIDEADLDKYAVNVTVPADVPVSSITARVTEVEGKQEARLSRTTITATRDIGDVKVNIPSGTRVTGPQHWDGTITTPTVKTQPSVAPDKLKTLGAVVEVGFGDDELTFDKPVQLILPGQAGMLAGYVRGGEFIKIPKVAGLTAVADGDNEKAATVLGTEKHGYADHENETDMSIWTTHFTEFVAYEEEDPVTPAPAPAPVAPGIQVTPAVGGMVRAHGVTVDFPAFAVEEVMYVNISRVVDTTALPLRDMLLSEVFEITLNKAVQLQKPVTITLPFDQDKLDQEQYEAGLFWYNEKANQWVSLDDVSVDMEQGLVSGKIDHFTKFAVLAVEKEIVDVVVELTDIEGHWAEDFIKELVAMEAIAGYPDKTFKPDNNITRAEFAAVVVGAYDLSEVPGQGRVFDDTDGHWAEEIVSIAASHGILHGYSETAFGPDDLITREQMAVMIVSAAGAAATTNGSTFADSDEIAAWAADSVDAAVQAGIITGYPDNTFKPKANATRAEAATVVINSIR